MSRQEPGLPARHRPRAAASASAPRVSPVNQTLAPRPQSAALWTSRPWTLPLAALLGLADQKHWIMNNLDVATPTNRKSNNQQNHHQEEQELPRNVAAALSILHQTDVCKPKEISAYQGERYG